MNHQLRKKKSHFTACNMSLKYIKNKSGSNIDSSGTPQDTDAG